MDIGEDITIKPVKKKTNKIQSGKNLKFKISWFDEARKGFSLL